jgi:hypothetical protein
MVAGILAVGIVRPGSLRGKPLWWWCGPRWGHAAGPLVAWSTLTHHPSLAAFVGGFVLFFHHDSRIHHGFQVIVWYGYQIGLQLLLKSIQEALSLFFSSVSMLLGAYLP